MLISVNIFSQERVNHIFTQHLLMDNVLILENKQQERLYDSSFIELEIDTLSSLFSNFEFYRFIVGKNKVVTSSENLFISFSSSSCKEYIIAFNNFEKKSYKLKGFNTNDLLFLISEIKKMSYEEYNSYKQIIRDLDELNIGINFKKTYNDILNLKLDSHNLKPCSDPRISHSE